MASKSVSLKPIINAIDEAMKQLDALPTMPGSDNTIARAKKALTGLRHTTEALCLPGFDVPDNQ